MKTDYRVYSTYGEFVIRGVEKVSHYNSGVIFFDSEKDLAYFCYPCNYVVITEDNP